MLSACTKGICGSLLLVLCCIGPAEAGGLRTHLGEVVVENLQIGRKYSLKDLANLRMGVTNTSEYDVELRMDVLIPDEAELKQQADPIPDPSWISLSCDSFSLDAGQEAVADITISIPDEERYLGKKFQVMIWSHTVVSAEGGMFLATGLKSRIIFATDSVRTDLPSGSIAPSGNAAFRVSPAEIHLGAVPLGLPYDARESGQTKLLITNPTDEHLTLKLYSKTVSGSLTSLEPGWEDTPDAGYLTFDMHEITVPPESQCEVGLFMHIPERSDLRGRRLMFLIHVCDEREEVTTGVYVRVFATLEK